MSDDNRPLSLETQLVHLGYEPSQQSGFVSPPIYRGSTAIYENMKSLRATVQNPFKKGFPNYGRFGSPTTRALETALAEIEGGADTVTFSSGLSAVTTSLLAFVTTGDHLLIVDSVYWPTRNFCDSLTRFGIEIQYYDPRIGAGIQTLIRPNTKLVFMESPGSLTFEVQDVPAIVSVCKKHNVRTLIDNTWATPVYFQPLKQGVDVSIHSGTKYITGHADSFLGVAICNDLTYPTVRNQAAQLGLVASAEDVYLGLRGLRTLFVRLEQHQKQALVLAEWLALRPEVAEVLYPALPSSPDHLIWKRDYSGASGLFGVLLQSEFEPASVDSCMDHLKLFGLGHSWGGYESLAILSDPSSYRSKSWWHKTGPLLRFHVGLENLDDLKTDLELGFKQLRKLK
jgi:cystathionine beta-lyase